MVVLLEKLMDFFSSLKLAITLILSLAFYLAAATLYEARYGTRAVQDCIYSSRPFLLIMALLAINVMGAVLVRYPWKRKQTGFIITHIGIETLLLGCLISFRYSVDGKVSMTPGLKTDAINLLDEQVDVTMPDAQGRQREYSVPIELWHEAGYPGMAKYIAGMAGLVDLPPEARWPQGQTLSYPVGGGAKLVVMDWLPAAVGSTVVKPVEGGVPTAIVHLGGSMPNGMSLNQDIPLMADDEGHGMSNRNGGMPVAIDLWKARSPAEVAEFLAPPAIKELPEMGRVVVLMGAERYTIDVSNDGLNKEQVFGNSGYKGAVSAYTMSAPPPKLPEGHGQVSMTPEAIDPQVEVDITGPKGTRKYLVKAWDPELLMRMEDTPGPDAAAAPAAASVEAEPLIYYWHPKTYFTVRGGRVMGRLQLLAAPDGKLYAHQYELLDSADQQPNAPFEVQVGKEFERKWVMISLSVAQYSMSGTLGDEFRPAHVEARQMDEHPRAIQVAMEVEGKRSAPAWLELGDSQGAQLATSRGPVQVDYNFREYPLGFTVGLDHAEQTNDPGTAQAATYTSEVTVADSGKMDGSHVITMNQPMTVSGLTFYQAGFADEDTPISTLSVRRDPGWVIKYLGCAGIVGGIFTMFYMKAYFQKTPAAVPKGAAAVRGKMAGQLSR